MTLDANCQRLIEAVAARDMKLARAWALAAVKSDTTKKNEWFCEKMLGRLSEERLSVPPAVEGMVYVEDPPALDEKRHWLTEEDSALIDRVRGMRQHVGELRSLGVGFGTGVLLDGEPGTGKTMLARRMAAELGLPLMSVRMSGLMDSLMGKTQQNVSKVFDYANSAGCLLLLDEFDAVSNARSGKASAAEREISRVTVTLMQELDRLDGGLQLVAATNRPDLIDSALLRRFPIRRTMTNPTAQDVRRFAEAYLADVAERSEGKICVKSDGADGWIESLSDGSATWAQVAQKLDAKVADAVLNDTYEIAFG